MDRECKKKKKKNIYFADNPDTGAGSRFPIFKLHLESFFFFLMLEFDNEADYIRI